MADLILLALLFYVVPALCAIVSIFRTGFQKTELQLLQLRVRELEAKLAALAENGTLSAEERTACAENESPAAVDFPEGGGPAFTFEKPSPFAREEEQAPLARKEKPASLVQKEEPASFAQKEKPASFAQEEQEEPASLARQTDWRPVFTAQGISFAPPDAEEPEPSLAAEESVAEDPVDEDPRETTPAVPGVLVTLWDWFRANPILYIGLAVFLMGMAFTLNFLTQNGYLTEGLRLSAAALVGAGFLGGGWKLRSRNELVAQALMGGGAVILYLTLFMAARLEVLGTGIVFFGMAALVVGTTLLAVKVDAHLLAVLATAGGFAVPVLLATDSGNHVGLFSYYALLSAGNLLLLRFRAWDIPALLSFAAVSLVGGLWARNSYQPAMFPEMEGFLILFFLIFSVILLQMLRHAQERPHFARRLVHASYLFGLPLAAFSCQYLLTRPYAYADALSALALTAWHLSLRYMYRKEEGPVFGLARDAFLILGVGFFALSVPLALHAPWITCTWALQGAGLVWLGMRQERRSLLAAGAILQLFGLADLLYNFDKLQTPVLNGLTNGFVIGVTALCLSGLAILREIHVHWAAPEATITEAEEATEVSEDAEPTPPAEATPPYRQRACSAAQVWAMTVWWLVVYFQFDTLSLSWDQWIYGLTCSTALCAFIWFLAGRRFGLRLWLYPVQGIWLLLLLYLPDLEYWGALFHPAEGGGMVEALALADFTAYGVLIFPMTHYAMQIAPELWQERWRHVSLSGLWLLAVFFGVYQWGHVLYPGLTLNAYAAFFWMLLPVAALLVFLPCVLRRLAPMPLYARNGGTVYVTLSCVLLAWLGVAFAVLCTYAGRTLTGYVPLFSWVDATQLLVLAALIALFWHLAAWRDKARGILGFGLFVLSTVMAARTVSAMTDIPYTTSTLLHDPAFRFVLSVLWGGTALGLMLASRLLKIAARRSLWLAGAVLLLLTMLKLLVLDMADRSTEYRMVSFLTMGLVMLTMGYFCPLPPKTQHKEDTPPC